MSARKRFSAFAPPPGWFCGTLAGSAASAHNVPHAETHPLEILDRAPKFQHFYADATDLLSIPEPL